MSQQLSLPGSEGWPPQADRLFFAILLSADHAARIAELTQVLRFEHGLKTRPNPLECLHISLQALGDYPGLPKNLVRTAKAAGASVSVPAFDVVLDRAMSFNRNGRKRPFVLRAGGDIPALLALHEALGTAMKNAGLGRWASPHFTPHMTLLYDHRIVMEREIQTVRWTVRDFALVHSLLGQTRYVQLARWPLQSAANSSAT